MRTLQKITAGALILTMLISAASCSLFEKKDSISADDFTKAMEDKDLTVEDATDQFEDEDAVLKCLLASTDDYQIEFYILRNGDQAMIAYNNGKEGFEESFSGTGSSHSEVKISNYSKFTMTTGEGYYVLSRIDNTLIYVEADKEYKDEIKDLLESVGY